jgi:hypothetical protein
MSPARPCACSSVWAQLLRAVLGPRAARLQSTCRLPPPSRCRLAKLATTSNTFLHVDLCDARAPTPTHPHSHTRAHRHPPTHTHTLAPKRKSGEKTYMSLLHTGGENRCLFASRHSSTLCTASIPLACDTRWSLEINAYEARMQFKRSAARTILNRTALRLLALWRAVRVCCGRDAGRVGCRAVSCTPCSSACHGIASAHVLRRRWPWGQDGTLCWCSTHHPSWQQLHSTQQLVSTPSCHECCGGDDTLSA